MSFDQAIASSTSSVLIVGGDKRIIGRGSKHISTGHWVGVRFEEGPVIDMARPFMVMEGPEREVVSFFPKHAYFRFLPNSGLFWGFPFDMEDAKSDEAYELFHEVRAVCEFNLGFGWVPTWFKDVEGYGVKIKEE